MNKFVGLLNGKVPPAPVNIYYFHPIVLARAGGNQAAPLLHHK